MTLAEVLKHVFTDKDLTKEVNNYSVTHTNTDNYIVELEGGSIIIQVTKKEN
jgi:hypothetical protein